VVTASLVFIYEYITASATVNQCRGFHHISVVIEGTYNNEVISIHFILINNSKIGQTKFKNTCQSYVFAIIRTWDLWFSADLEEGRVTCVASVLTTTGLSVLWRR
jgi:hypothetical protein